MPRQFQEMAAKSLHIPADVALGEPVITITGRRRVYLENYELLFGECTYKADSDRVKLNQIEQELKESPLDFKYETQAEWVEQALSGGYPGYWDVQLHLDYWDAGAFEIKNQIEPEWADGTVRVYADIDDDFSFETDTPGYSAGYTGSK